MTGENIAPSRTGLTLVELLVAIGVVGVLVGLLLPAIQGSRESARRATCANNLRQVGVSLLQHEDVQQAFPVGAKGNGTYGMSWWVDLLPFLEESALFDQLDRGSAHCGSPVLHASNGRAIDQVLLSFMLCPSSPLPPFWRAGAVEVLMPSYVGISGATSHEAFPEIRVEACCLPLNDGEISAGGVLVPNRRIALREVSDGLSKTVAIGECSDVSYGVDGNSYRIDGGYHYGWLTGTFMVGTPPGYATTIAPNPYNLTTIRYEPNMRDYNMPGIYSGHGANNPLTAAHPGGVHVCALDGSVRFLHEGVSRRLLKCLATRDDGITQDAEGQ